MGEILVKDKDIVIPGEVLAVGMDYLPAICAFREEDKIVASQIGLVNLDGRLIRVIPLKGKYTPKRDDIVIGIILDMNFNNWFVDIGCSNNAVLSVREATEFVERGADLSQFYSFGDLICAKISNLTRSSIDLSMRAPGLRKLGPGRMMRVDPTKVPRIIGKQGSMISIIKQKTGCRVIAGQNGWIWIQGDPKNETVAAETIEMISKEAHREGLTERVAKVIEEKLPQSMVRSEDERQNENLEK